MSNYMARCYAKEGNEKFMRSCLDESNIDDVENFDGYNVLHAAVDGNQIKCVQTLLEYSLDINKKTKDMYPVRNEKKVKRLIRCISVSDWNRPDYSTTQTALHIACRKNHSEIAKLLLQYHADPNILDDRSLTPLCAALLCNSVDCVNVLLDFGVPLGFATSVAALKKNVDALRKMTLRYPFEDFWFPYHKTDKAVILDPLSSAAYVEHLESMQLLLDYAMEAKKDVVNAKGFEGKTPIMYASDVKCLKLLLNHGADVNLPCGVGKVALSYTLVDQKEDSTRLVMERMDFRKVKRLRRQGGVLVQAIREGMIGIAKILLRNGFRVGVDAYCEYREEHYTPLMAAIEAGNRGLADKILQRGGNVNRWFSMNPVTNMIDRGDESLAQWLIDAGFDVNSVSFDGHCDDYYESWYFIDDMSKKCMNVLELFLKAGVMRVSDLISYYMLPWYNGMRKNTKLSHLVRRYGRQRDWIQFAGQHLVQWREDSEVSESLNLLLDEVCSLKDLCRLEIRHLVMGSGKHSSMFKVNTGRLGLPKRLQDYILHVGV